MTPVNVLSEGEIERAIANFARVSNGGSIVTASGWTVDRSELIIALAAQYKLPAVTSSAASFLPVVWPPMGRISSTSTAARPVTSTVSSKAKSPLIFLCRRRPSTNW